MTTLLTIISKLFLNPGQACHWLACRFHGMAEWFLHQSTPYLTLAVRSLELCFMKKPSTTLSIPSRFFTWWFLLEWLVKH